MKMPSVKMPSVPWLNRSLTDGLVIANLQALTGAPSAHHRKRLVLGTITQFLVATWLLILVAAVGNLWARHDAALQAARIEVANLADTVAQQVAARFDRVDLIITGLLERLETDGTGPGAITRLNKVLATHAGADADRHMFCVVDAGGVIVASSSPGATVGVDVSGRESYEYHRAHDDSRTRLGGPYRSQTDGRWIMTLSRRWNQPDGQFGGEVLGRIDLDEIQASFASLNLGPSGNVALWRSDFVMLARLPPAPDAIGKAFHSAAADLVLRGLAGSGTFDTHSALDKIERVYGARRVVGYDLVQFVGIGRDDVLAPWRAELRLTAAMVAGLLLLTGGVAAWVHHQARQRLAEQAAYRMLAECATDVIFYHDTNLVRRYVSPAAQEILGYRPEEMVGDSSTVNVHPDDECERRTAFNLVLAGVERHNVSYRTRHGNGGWVWVDVQLRRIVSQATGEVIGLIGSMRDDSARKASEAALEAANRNLATLANLDGLTSLSNRRHFDERLEHEWRRARRDTKPLSLVLIDVDRFKCYNDRYGHLAGDACLRTISDIVATALHRPADLAARYGGEELVVLLPDTMVAGALLVAERITTKLRQKAIAHADGVGRFVTISVGVATRIPNAADDGDTLIDAADKALYAAKAGGRATIVVAPDSHHAAQPAARLRA